MMDYSIMTLRAREQTFIPDRLREGPFPAPKYAIVWEDPSEPDEPAKITIPSSTWLAMAMHGGILPPVEVYHELAADGAQPGFTRHTRGHLLHETPPVPAMTEEEAMEYLVKKDIPQRVWRDYRGNRVVLKIVPRHLIPTDNIKRNALRINQKEDA